MPNVKDEARAREVKEAIANINISSILNKIQEQAIRAITGLRIADLHNDEFVCSLDGVQVRIVSPELIQAANAIDQQCREAQRALPSVLGTEGKRKPGRPFKIGKIPLQASRRPLVSINASVGQTRRRAIDKGDIQAGDSLPEDIIKRLAVRNSLADPYGNIPPDIHAKLRSGALLDMQDLQQLAPQGAVKASVSDVNLANDF